MTHALTADSGPPSPTRTPAVVGRRVVLSGALGLAAGAALRPSLAFAASGSAAGATIYSYGHSYTMMPNPYVSRRFFDEYQLDLGRRLQSGPVISRGRSSFSSLDTASAIIAPVFARSTTARWQIGAQGIVLLETMMMDASSQVGGSTDYLNAYETALRLTLGVFGARSFLHADVGARVGRGWAVRAYDRLENGRTWSTSTYGDKISFTITGGDTVHISTLCTDAAALIQGTLQADCNGVNLGYFGRGADRGTNTCNRGASYPTINGGINRWSPGGWRIGGLNAAAGTSGTMTLTLRKVDKSAAPVWIQGVYLPAGAAPPVFVAKEPPRNPGAVNQRANVAFYANQGAYRRLIDSVCEEYSQAFSVDLAPRWNNTTMVSTLDRNHKTHPNTLGMRCIAGNFQGAINNYLRTSSLGLC